MLPDAKEIRKGGLGKRLILFGGDHAHMMTYANIRTLRIQGHEITGGQPDEYQSLLLRDGSGMLDYNTP